MTSAVPAGVAERFHDQLRVGHTANLDVLHAVSTGLLVAVVAAVAVLDVLVGSAIRRAAAQVAIGPRDDLVVTVGVDELHIHVDRGVQVDAYVCLVDRNGADLEGGVERDGLIEAAVARRAVAAPIEAFDALACVRGRELRVCRTTDRAQRDRRTENQRANQRVVGGIHDRAQSNKRTTVSSA